MKWIVPIVLAIMFVVALTYGIMNSTSLPKECVNAKTGERTTVLRGNGWRDDRFRVRDKDGYVFIVSGPEWRCRRGD